MSFFGWYGGGYLTEFQRPYSCSRADWIESASTKAVFWHGSHTIQYFLWEPERGRGKLVIQKEPVYGMGEVYKSHLVSQRIAS